jgi:hypothetical protein
VSKLRANSNLCVLKKYQTFANSINHRINHYPTFFSLHLSGFGNVTSKGQQFDKAFMDGVGAFNNDAEANIKLASSAARVMRFDANVASNARVLWPEYESLRPYVGTNIAPYTSNFNLTSSCALRAAMCCFVEDRMDGVLESNSVACRHDIADSRQSSNLNSGWGIYNSTTTKAYCTATAWGAENSTSELYKGNALYDISFGTMLRKGYVKNIDGAPMCGCVENMPVVSNTDCRELTVSKEEYSITITSAGALNIIQIDVVITYIPCTKSPFITHYSTLASTQEIAKMQTRIVGDCKVSNAASLNDRFLVETGKPSSQFTYPSEAIWQQVAGTGLAYYPVVSLNLTVRDTEFRALFANSPNKIIYRHCETCLEQHQHVFYRRLTPVPAPASLNFLDLFLSNWFSKNNTLGVDFDLYSSYADALAQTNKWLYCNYDDPNVGFPRDCGRTAHTPCQWNSFTKGVCGGDYAPTSLGFYVEKMASA